MPSSHDTTRQDPLHRRCPEDDCRTFEISGLLDPVYCPISDRHETAAWREALNPSPVEHVWVLIVVSNARA